METDAPVSRSRPRPWLIGALGVAAVALVANQMWPHNSATPLIPSSNPGRNARSADHAIDPAELAVRLGELKAKRPDPRVERNPFRFQPPPTPPEPTGPKPTTEPMNAGPPPPPAPPPISPIPLKFMGTVERGDLKLAALTDCKGFTYAGRAGETIDGRFRLVSIGVESVVMEYPNGTGRTTIRKSGECPK
jgi:hypothetical protein